MGVLQKLFGDEGWVFLRGLEPRTFWIVLGAMFFGGAAFITYERGPVDRITSSLIIAMLVAGVFLMILGLLTKNRFAEWGMINLRKFHHSPDMERFLSSCTKDVTVLKTWFPEDNDIARGLEKAVTNGARVQLILCHPKVPILGQRSRSTDHEHQIAAKWIYRGLEVVSTKASREKFNGVFLYDAWPGCPVILADGRMFMGFYFWGYTSPTQPWVEVKANSDLWNVLTAQLEKLRTAASVTLKDLDALGRWMDENPAP